MTQIEIPFGRGTLRVNVPDGVLGEVVSPERIEPAADPDGAIETALTQPIGSPTLERIVHAGQKVAVIVDDNTRETPVRQMLPPVLERLTAVGARREDISLVMALGTHRPMTRGEITAKVGPTCAREFEIVNVPCWDQSHSVYLGTSSNGIPGWVNRVVAAADLRVGIGSIVPHPDTGYSGGAKIILPGVCSNRTVNVFHARGAMIRSNMLGVVESPMRRDLEQFVGERVGLDFILNTILTQDGDLYQCVAGHFVYAHRAGVSIARQVYGVSVARRYPLVIANAFPSQLDLWQSSKGLWTGEPIVCDGGTLILLTSCEEGNSIHPLFADYLGRDPDILQDELDAGRAEDPNACAPAIQVGRMRRRIKFGLVSPGLSRAEAARMDFAYYDSVEEAIAAELAGSTGSDASVGVLTHGGFTIPLVQ